MSASAVPRLSKWPFLVSDLLLVGFAVFLVHAAARPISVWEAFVCLTATVAGACFATIPFLRDQRAELKLAEADALATTVGQIRNLERIKEEIVNATGQWQGVQQHSSKAVAAAQEIHQKMRAELGEFCEFLKKSNDLEKGNLRLEIEKLRRGEGEWLQVTVHLLDHVFALHAAAGRSRQPALIAQLDQFQAACRDAVRRMGLSPFLPSPQEVFHPQAHQAADPDGAPTTGVISEVLAPGYTYQGQVVRRALVRVVEVPQSPGLAPGELGATAEASAPGGQSA